MRVSSRSLCVCVLLAAAANAVHLGARERRPNTIGRLDLVLTTDPDLSESARISMMSEAGAIWRRHGIVIEWLPPAVVRSATPHRLRVLVIRKRLAVDPALEPVAIGELMRPSSGHPIAIISIEAAKHLVSSVTGRMGEDLAAVDERRLGKVLGRTLAHEIGHYLLDTHTHAQRGLMRPNFDAFEFTDLRDGAFALDRDAATWLRTRDAEKFVYAQR
jgi:hypothetical protein